ncbi:MAG: N-methyl-D-aspartate receptor NMDAR2C subunit [Candidatus Pacebacteria bacterium]|nr:N-methyl-D-aspartate receptor NMDAR2C subunit [Candidatus Paceibacterota bacterium]
MTPYLEEKWFGLWSLLDHQGNPEALLEDLAKRYSEEGRAYHTLAHIEHCLREFDDAVVLASGSHISVPRKAAIEFALWYHDIFYDTHASDNEERSAVYAEAVLADAKCLTVNARLVGSHIRATDHKVSVRSNFVDEGHVVDADLSILGQSEEMFDEYERQIREEYHWVPEEQFRAGRARVLSSILAKTKEKPSIYRLSYYRDEYEKQARRNLERSLSLLS